MFRVIRESFFSAVLRKVIYRVLNYLENINNADFYANGEDNFLKNYCKQFSGSTMRILDVGANLGKYTEVILSYGKQYNVNCEVHLFEPTSNAFSALLSKFASNEKIHLNNFAISSEEGKAVIYFDKEGSSLASLYQRDLKEYNISMGGKEEILLKRLDEYIFGLKSVDIDLLKLDVEGHEVSALNSIGEFLSPSRIKVIQFEYGGANLDSRTFLKDLYQIFESKGYKIFKIAKNGIEAKKYSSRMENFQYSNYLAISPDLL